MRAVFMGTPDFSVGTLEEMIRAGHQVVGVFTQPDKPKGRGKSLQMTPVKEAALAHGIPVYQPVKIREPENMEILKELAPEVIVVVAFGQIIPRAILELPKYGCINVHASLLPKYRGAAPIQWAVIDGEETSGVTIMQMDEGLDTGDMLLKGEIALDPQETGGSLFDRLSALGARLLVEALAQIEAGTIAREKQPQESPTPYAAQITKAQGEIRWEDPAVKIERLIRGLNPWPSAYTRLGGKTLKLWKAQALPQEENSDKEAAPGTVVARDRESITVQTGQGLLKLLEVQLEGKKRMDTASFLRGYSLEEGTRLG
ncbi:MAG TPA: methionyl-tRNA formyltransferase [Candidatus Egerieimonas intestinavium]|uniref:Methionyl-tRNA formyltransferase n=1 Tax=Candidatus Egerieimonas intestinavium TaxID=2840777 RepID=A0A9D1JF59_9FIRM|nr:methionyl-tRNA formyltransferase [Candidatus Egerieimonas intestinavium]